MNIKESKTKIWTGIYKGINFEINNFRLEGIDNNCWTYYLILHLDRIPLKYKPNSFWLRLKKNNISSRGYYNYYKHKIINNIEFQGGCTWYSKEGGFDNTEKIIKIGCDFQHIWNENKKYSLDAIKIYVKNTINHFITLIPDYRYWCSGNGKLYSKDEGIIKDGAFNSKEYFGKQDWFKKLYKLKK